MSGGNWGENMEYTFTKVLDNCKKGDEYYFQYWNSSGENIQRIDFALIPLSASVLAGDP